MYNAKEVMLCWNPGGDVALISWPDKKGLSDKYVMSQLACNFFIHDLNFEQRKTYVFIESMHLIVRDGCDPQKVHKALLDLEEYRDGCSDDMPGIKR